MSAKENGIWIAVVLTASLAGGDLRGIAEAQCPQYEVTIIQAPDCGVFGHRATSGYGINEVGHVVGKYCDCICGTDQAFFWSPGTGMITLEGPPGVLSASADDINEADQIVGTMEAPATRGFLYQGGMWTELPPQPGGAWSYATGINDEGKVVGFRSLAETDNPMTAFVWTDSGGFVDLGDLGHPFGTVAAAINSAGQIVGWRGYSSFDEQAFFWDDKGTTFLGPIPGGFTSAASDINVQGEIVGIGLIEDPNSESTTGQAFVWESGMMNMLENLPGYEHTSARGMNDLGQIVGHVTSLSDERRAVVWEDGTIHDLNDLVPPGLGVIERAFDVNNAGQIIADGNDAAGDVVAFLLTPLVPPAADLNGDCEVGFADPLVLLSGWGPCGACMQDLDGDGVVGFSDLLALFLSWT